MRVLAVLVLGMVLLGCGADFNGVFVGNETANRNGTAAYSGQMTLTESQQGNQISGNFTSTAGTSGMVSGIVNGATISSLQVTMSPNGGGAGNGCSGQLNGTGNMTNNILTLTLTGANGSCQGVTDSIQLQKQSGLPH